MTSPLDIEALEKAARAAAPGPWKLVNRNASGADDDFLGWDWDEDHEGNPPEPGRGVLMGPEARYLNAAYPAVILTLIAQRAALVDALIDARRQLEVYEKDLTSETYNDLEINAALQPAGVVVSQPAIYVVMRRDLAMRRGKEIAQACHAVLGLDAPDDGPLIGLQVAAKDDLLALVQEAIDAGVGHYMVHDAGHTEIPAGTLTCAAIGPVTKGALPLLSAARLY